MKRLLVTGSNGLIGSEMVSHFHKLGWEVHGIDNNMRVDFFGPEGDTRWNQERLLQQFARSFRPGGSMTIPHTSMVSRRIFPSTSRSIHFLVPPKWLPT